MYLGNLPKYLSRYLSNPTLSLSMQALLSNLNALFISNA